MPSWQTHLAQAKHNDEFANRLIEGDEDVYDWAITATFYSALHYLEAWLMKSGVNVIQEARVKGKSPHSIRSQKVADMLPPDIAKLYVALQRQSELCRYLTTKGWDLSGSTSFQYFHQGAAKSYHNDLQAFKNHLDSLM